MPFIYEDDAKESEYYVVKKYENFKEEVLQYYLLTVSNYKKEIIPKVKEYQQTNIVKLNWYHLMYPLKINNVMIMIKLIKI